MLTLDNTPNTVSVESLRIIPLLADLPEDLLAWIIQESEVWHFKKGEVTFTAGSSIDHMTFLLEGKVQIQTPHNGVMVPFLTNLPGAVSGVLPYSRMKVTTGQGLVLEDTLMLALHRDKFRELEHKSTEIIQRLVEMMTDRVREVARSQQQSEKLLALGKLSAGLAHELNNPVAAIQRAAQDLHNQLAQVDTEMLELHKCKIDPDKLAAAFATVRAGQALNTGEKLTLLQRDAREEEIVELLLDALPQKAEEVAPCLAESGITATLLASVQHGFETNEYGDFVEWLAATCAAQRLATDIVEAATRISALVGSIKSYSHMDQSPGFMPTNIHEGLKSTLVMIGHKLRNKRIELVQDYDESLGNVNAIGNELNQVWTNLLVNALDALPDDGTGKITIRSYGLGTDFVNVDILDNGTGIPEDIQHRIFEPFFTTKGVGQGTGLGLDITARIIKNHNGSVKVKSQPGQTIFTICLPLIK